MWATAAGTRPKRSGWKVTSGHWARRESGLLAELAVHGDGRPEAAVTAMDGLLKLADPPTAVCCYNDMTAMER